MESAIFWFVDQNGRPRPFDLAARRVLNHAAAPPTGEAERPFAAADLGSPERLMQIACEGRLPKQALAGLLRAESRQRYLKACADIERKYTEACTAKKDPCLESGCAVEGEICLQPLLRAGVDYQKACAAEWLKLFRNPANRIDAWKN
jgi:hypothetical protein